MRTRPPASVTLTTLTLAALTLPVALLTAPLGFGCGAADYGASAAGSSFSDAGTWSAADPSTAPDASDSAASDAAASDIPPPPPPEVERDFDLRTPEAGDRYLYIPSAALDALVIIDASTLEVHLIQVGLQPTIVRALPGDAGAVVLNAHSADVSVVRPRGEGEFDVTQVAVRPAHNRLALSPDGRWALAWFDPRASPSGAAGGGGLGSTQDVSAIRLAEGQQAVYSLAVCPHPERPRFADEGRLALFFCDNGISGVRLDELAADTFLPPVRVDDDPFHEAIDREIAVTPDGRYAVVRDLSATGLTLVDLDTAARSWLPLPDWPSDLDLTPDGGTAVVPLMASERVALITIPDAFAWLSPEDDNATAPANPFVVLSDTGAPFGAAEITGDGAHALLYTTVAPITALGMVDTTTGEALIQPLPRPITSVLLSPDARTAVLPHRALSAAAEGAHATADPAVPDAYSLLDLDTGFSKLVPTPHPIGEVIFTDDSAEIFVLVPDPTGDDHLVHRVSTASFAVTPYAPPEAPTFVGAMPAAHKVAIALDDPTGWLTLIDTEDGEVDQLNSFELNGLIQ